MNNYQIKKIIVQDTIFPNEKVLISGPLYKDDSLDVLNFSARVLNTLVMNGYETVGQFYFAPTQKLQKIRNVGLKTLSYFANVKKAIREKHLPLSSRPHTIEETMKPVQETVASHIPYLSETDKERMRLVKRLYDEYETLDKVGSLLRLSRERIRQILNKGQRYGLFTYQLSRDKKFDETRNKINKEQLKELIRTTRNQFDICSKLEIDINTLQRLIKYYNIDLESYKQDARYSRYLTEYSEIVRILGHHPSTTVLQHNKKWRKIAVGINRLWGGFDRFRSEFGIERPKYSMHPNTLAAWNLARQKRIARKKERVKTVYKLVKGLGPISCRKISETTGLRTQNINLYLNDLIEDKLIKRIGRGIKVKYKIT
jgi:hypothetical protein